MWTEINTSMDRSWLFFLSKVIHMPTCKDKVFLACIPPLTITFNVISHINIDYKKNRSVLFRLNLLNVSDDAFAFK